jgi:hypothetical protein
MTRSDPRVRFAFDSQADLRAAFLDVLASVSPDLLPDLWTDRKPRTWAARHRLTDTWIKCAARQTIRNADAFASGRCPEVFFVDMSTEGGWTAEVNATGATRPARPAMPAPNEPGGLRPFLVRWRQYRHRLAAWSDTPVSARWHATPEHLRWCALRLTGESWAAIASGEAHGDDRLVRRRVKALAGRLGLTLP